MNLDTAAFVFKVLIALVLIAGIVKVFVKERKRKNEKTN